MMIRARCPWLPCAGRFGTPKRRVLLAFLVCTAGLLLIAGCEGGTSDSNTTATAGGGLVTTSVQEATMSPDELGDTIGATWVEAMQKLNDLLESKPEAAAVKSQIEQLKEEYIGKLLDLGRQRETFSTSDKAQAGLRTVAALEAAGDEAWYATYNSLYQHYSGGDLEFANLLASFNILTQYAEFDLLKQQSPGEAARLGIE